MIKTAFLILSLTVVFFSGCAASRNSSQSETMGVDDGKEQTKEVSPAFEPESKTKPQISAAVLEDYDSSMNVDTPESREPAAGEAQIPVAQHNESVVEWPSKPATSSEESIPELEMAEDEESCNKYYILVDKAAHVLGVYEQEGGTHARRLIKQFPIATGRRCRLTPSGTFFLGNKERWKKWRPSGGCAPYASNFALDHLYIHGPIYKSPKDGGSMHAPSYTQIGSDATSGCLRTTSYAAYWIFTNCPTGTVIEIKTGGTGLIYPGKPEIDPNYPTWDPTDPSKPESF
ncbi:L,D-transpeptidase [Planctomycetota bacterium]